jgi:Tubulin-tyrosine ligase family.
MRVITVFLDGRVTLTRFGLRIGLDGQEWISRYSGYYYASIYADGTIDTRLQNEQGKWLSSEDIGLFGPGYKLPCIEQIINKAKRLHLKLPHFKIIGWDFTIDESGEPVLIEYNTSPGIMVQMTNCRPFFGDLTDRILDDYFIHRTLEKNQLQGLLVHP